ncbi:hypothetical protein J6590_022609 [Homalodisca vitripennis]|nr:hypothetical protein J6590_022609 [Homalodisca vitripennis]
MFLFGWQWRQTALNKRERGRVVMTQEPDMANMSPDKLSLPPVVSIVRVIPTHQTAQQPHKPFRLSCGID